MVHEGQETTRRFTSVDEALAFAIGQEEKAAAFYRGFAERTTHPGLRRMCQEMAEEEDRHRQNLVELREGNADRIARDRVRDLRISDYLRDFQLDPQTDQQDLLIAAMKSEARAERLYRDLAAATEDPHVRRIFQRLAAEEGSHKDVLEKDYDDNILGQN